MAGMSTAKPSSQNSLTPVRRQYLRIKQRYPDTLLLFRMGDFYETFDEDAHTASQALDIALTSRSMGKGSPVPLAGVPAHSLETLPGPPDKGRVQGRHLRAALRSLPPPGE